MVCLGIFRIFMISGMGDSPSRNTYYLNLVDRSLDDLQLFRFFKVKQS